MKSPRSLLIVGLLFMLGGALALADVVQGFVAGRVHLDLGVIQLPIGIGIGLLAHSAYWRRWAIGLIGLIGLGYVIAAAALCFGLAAGSVEFRPWFGEPKTIPSIWVLPFVWVAFLFLRWQHSVLEREDVLLLFHPDPERSLTSSDLHGRSCTAPPLVPSKRKSGSL